MASPDEIKHGEDGAPAPPTTEAPLAGSFTRRKIFFGVLFSGAVILALYVLLPQVARVNKTWERIGDASPWWLVLALAFTCVSYLGYVAMFQAVYVQEHKFTWRESYHMTMAGLAASRLFTAAGAGGIILTAWALRRSGMSARQVADKTIAFIVLTYIPYVGAVILVGLGLYFGLFGGGYPFTITLLPAILGLIVVGIALAMAFIPRDVQKGLESQSHRRGFVGRLAHRAAQIPASISSGVHDAFRLIRTRNPALLGTTLFWTSQIAVMWTAFEAFGESPPVDILIMGFFLGMLGNLLPIPGGVGGVDGGLVGFYSAFNVDPGVALVAVLTFRAYEFWLPTIPGIISYFRLRKTVERWRRTGRTPVGLR